MHFWIDKRSSAEWGRRGGGLCGGGKAMVTPVHRFQAVEAVVGRSHHAAHHPQRYTPHHHHHQQPRHSVVSSARAPHATPAVSRQDLDAAAVFLDHHHLACGGGGAARPSLAATGRLKCGMWASFALVTVFMAGAKIYFNTQGTGMEVLVFCALLVVVLFAGCAVSLCEAVAQPPQPQGVVSTAPTVVMVPRDVVQQQAAVATAAASSEAVGPEPPPPPYHIAVLLPPPPAPPSPPPAYDKAITVS